MASRIQTQSPSVRDDYLDLVKRFPLVPIKNDQHLKAAHRIIDELSIMDESELTEGQRDYLLVLGDLTCAYEAEAFNELTRNASGLDVLKQLMQEHALSASDIGRIIGQRELGSKVLKGIRRITRQHAKSLGSYFGLPGEIFLR